ncbi:hypothetical protein C8J57DRAFT_1315389 [Mycena rebaudengoi]|nr:hypothetical protein C8J57DRAFT_1315389 [Mycena rebaudengoi]
MGPMAKRIQIFRSRCLPRAQTLLLGGLILALPGAILADRPVLAVQPQALLTPHQGPRDKHPPFGDIATSQQRPHPLVLGFPSQKIVRRLMSHFCR